MTLILMTGASGAIGGMLWQRLTRHELRLTDVPAEEGVDALDVTDAAAVERVCRGVDAVVHLGGIAEEGPFEDVLAVNVRGTERVLHAAHRTGVPRVLLASSNHAAGLYHRSIDWWAGRWQPDRWEPHIKFGTARSSDGLHSAAWSTVWCRVSPGISTHRCERCSRKTWPAGWVWAAGGTGNARSVAATLASPSATS